MNVVPSVVVEPTAAPTTVGPPGDPPGGFDQVLGAEQARAETPRPAGARTARAEGDQDRSGESGVTADADGLPVPPVVPRPVERAEQALDTPPSGDADGDGTADGEGLPPGLRGRDVLPPGLAKRDTLPPGLAKRIEASVAAAAELIAPEQPVSEVEPAVPVIPPPIPVEETGTSVTTPAGAEPLSDAGEVPTPVSDGEVQTDKEGEQATGGSTVSETGEHADPQQLVSSESTTPVSSSSEQTAATPAEVPAEGLPGTISAAASPVVAGADEREPDTSGSRSTTNRRRLERAESIAQRLGGAADTAAGAVSTDADVTPSRSLTPEAGGHPGAAPTSGGSTSQPGTPALTPGVPAAGGPIGELGEAGLGRLSGGPTRSRLSELADIASTVIRVTAREGKAAARITLRPAELGDVEIRLRYHAGGVSADVVADSPQAAQTLSQAVGELRRSLETQGLVVHWLDVRTGDDGRRAWQEAWHPGQGEARGRRDPLEELDELRSPTPVDAAALPGTGGSVDVLV